MRARFIVTLTLALLAASCADDGVFSTVPTTSTPTSAGSTTTTAATAPSTTGAAESTTTTAGTTEWAWSRIAPEEGGVFGGPEDQALGSVVVGGPGLVAVGSDFTGGDYDAAVWTSPDGVTWSRLPHDEGLFGGPDYQRMFGLAPGGPGLVAVGFDGSGGDWDAAVWVSPDGVIWSRAPHDETAFGGPERQAMQQVVAGGPGLVAIGWDSSGGDDDVAVWTSADGIAWLRVPHDEALFGGADDQEARTILAGGPGLAMAGVDYSYGEGDAVVWISPDGSAWTRVPQDEAVFGGPDTQVVTDLVAGPAGLVAVGSDFTGGFFEAAVWVSPDGVTWSRVPHDETALGGSADQSMRTVVAAGAVLVATGSDTSGGDRDVAVWTSADGVSWIRLPHDEAVFGGLGDQWVFRVVVGGPGLVAVGLNDTGADRDGALWVAVPSG